MIQTRSHFDRNNSAFGLISISFALIAMLVATPVIAANGDLAAAITAWWVWPLAVFVASFLIGIVGVMAGVGGGVLFVPIIGSFFPFHLDFVRGAGLMLALSGALSAGPQLLRGGFASLRLAMPLALVGSITAIIGAAVGLALPQHIVQTALGLLILAIALLLWRVPSGAGGAPRVDRLAVALGLRGAYYDASQDSVVEWQAHRTVLGLVLFSGIGFLAGFFGLGAGWANVPVLNLVMGLPLKAAAATSSFILSIVDTSAAWVYINRGALLPIVAVPSILGVMVGARIGAKLLGRTKTTTIRKLVLLLLLVAGGRALLKGLGV
jgi:uncharacterized protein